nr:dynamin-like 120 kDa protein, mitochondrial isoform X3 [Penaeus vannamei]
MQKLVKGRFGYIIRVVGVSQSRWARQMLTSRQDHEKVRTVVVPVVRHYSSLRPLRGDLLKFPGPNYGIPSRGIGMIVARVLRGALKIRYLLLGGTIAGGSALAKTYEQWKEALPDTKFLEELMPSQEELDAIRTALISYRDKIKDSVPDFTLDPKLKELGESKYDQLVLWFKERLDDAIKAAEEEKTEGSGFFTDGKEEDDFSSDLKQHAISFSAMGSAAEKEREKAVVLDLFTTTPLGICSSFHTPLASMNKIFSQI